MLAAIGLNPNGETALMEQYSILDAPRALRSDISTLARRRPDAGNNDPSHTPSREPPKTQRKGGCQHEPAPRIPISKKPATSHRPLPGSHPLDITEGPQTREILLGVKKSFTSFFTQKTEFKSGASMLRPGALLTLVIDGENHPLLFLHLKSFIVPKGFGRRDDMTQRAIEFRKTLNEADKNMGGTGRANFIFLGDLNTMGMNLTYSDKDVSGREEIARLRKRLAYKSVDMRILDKSAGPTFWPGAGSKYEPSDLDHVVAAKHLQFKQFSGVNVEVRGWVGEPTDAAKDEWAEKYSDHALVYFEVQKV